MQYVVRFVVDAKEPKEAARIALGRLDWFDDDEIEVWPLEKSYPTDRFRVLELVHGESNG